MEDSNSKLWPNGPTAEQMFNYHPPVADQAERYEFIRTKCRELAERIAAVCPSSATRTLAIRHVHLAMMLANASIAVNESFSNSDDGPVCHAINSW